MIDLKGVATGLAALLLLCTYSRADDRETGPVDHFQKQVLPRLERLCVDCHSGDDPEAGIRLDGFGDQEAAFKDERTWFRVRDAIEGGIMPPADAPQASAEDRSEIISWIENDYLAAQCGKQVGSGPVVIRRLNRQEYNNTIRDLFGLDLHLADAFPPDDIGFGFDNVGSALNISPIHVEKYLEAAELALDRAIVLPNAEDMPPIELIGLKTYPLPPGKSVEFQHTLKPGRYLADFSLVRVAIAEAVPPPRIEVGLGKDRRIVEAARVQDETVLYRFWIDAAAGDDTVHVALAPGQAESANVVRPREVAANVSGDQRYENDHGLHVDSFVVRGPAPSVALPGSHRKVLSCEPGIGDSSRLDAARRVISRFAERAFRRPVSAEEVERISQIFRLAQGRGESFEGSLQIALTAVLASPHFWFLIEPGEIREDRPLTEFELASRLSYFLWSSMPDDELAREALGGTLRSNLRRQVGRMLDDPRSGEFVKNFAGQWLQLRRLDGIAPDEGLFPDFDDKLRAAMRTETEQFFDSILRENRSVLEMLDSDYSFLNELLARHYGIEGVAGDQFRRVSLPDRRRGGVMTQASILTLTSNPNRTSPVKRGQWILQQLLGTPPPPPPPDAGKLDESRQAADHASLRERMEVHRSNPKCASCHQQMDPIGFALENYDAIGRWRLADGPFAIDPAGELVGGQKFGDVRELKKLLSTRVAKKFSRTLVQKLLTYGLGRGLETSDFCTVEEIRGRLAADQYRIRTIIFGIAESRAFQHRGVAQ